MKTRLNGNWEYWIRKIDIYSKLNSFNFMWRVIRILNTIKRCLIMKIKSLRKVRKS